MANVTAVASSSSTSTTTATSTYKTGIRRTAALNDVAALPTVTLTKSPAPVPLAIQ